MDALPLGGLRVGHRHFRIATAKEVYTDAGRREGLEVRAAYVHDLKAGKRLEVPVHADRVEAAEKKVRKFIGQIRNREFDPTPGKHCGRCDVRRICPSAAG